MNYIYLYKAYTVYGGDDVRVHVCPVVYNVQRRRRCSSHRRQQDDLSHLSTQRYVSQCLTLRVSYKFLQSLLCVGRRSVYLTARQLNV